MSDSEETWPEQEGPATEQERIAFLRGEAVPDREGFVFGPEVTPDGDVFDIEVLDPEGVSLGTARGRTKAEIIERAQTMVDESGSEG